MQCIFSMNLKPGRLKRRLIKNPLADLNENLIKILKDSLELFRVLVLAIKVFKSFLFLGLFWGLGELIQRIFLLPIPGSILGMAFIFISLRLNWIRLVHVKKASDFLLKYLALFFVPYGVGLMTYYTIIENDLIIVVSAVVISSVITLYGTAYLFQKFE